MGRNNQNKDLLTLDEYRNKYGYSTGNNGGSNGLMTYDEYQDFVNRQAQIRKEQAEFYKNISEMTKKNNRVISQYQMHRQNPTPWVPQRMQRLQTDAAKADKIDSLLGKKQTQTGSTKGLSFPEQGRINNILNPKSKTSDWLSRNNPDLLKGLQAQYAENPYAALNPVAEEDLGGWLQAPTENYQKAMSAYEAQKNINKIYGKGGYIEQGSYGDSGDYNLLNSAQRKQEDAKLYAENLVLENRKKSLQKQISALEDKFDEMNIEEYDAQIRTLYEEMDNIESRQRSAQKNRERLTGVSARAREYDRLMGNGDEGRISALEKEIANLEQQYTEMEDRSLEMDAGPEFNQLMTDMGQLDTRIRNEKEQLEKLKGSYLGDTRDTTYHEEWDKGRKSGLSLAEMEQGIPNASVDQIYSFLTEGNEYKAWGGGAGHLHFTNDYNGAMAMLPEEKDKFIALYNTAMSEGREATEAKAFMDALQPYLNQRYRMYEQIQNRQTARMLPITSTAADVLGTVAEPFMALGIGIGKLTDADWVKDPNSRFFREARFQSDIENQIVQDLGPTWGTFYKGGVSGLKNAVRGLESMGFGAGASAVNLALFFGEDFYQSYQQKLEETGDADAAGLYALVDAGIATLFETVSVEAMFSDSKNIWQAFIKNVLAEASEELNEGIFGPYIHQILDGSNEWRDRADDIMNAGGYEDANGNWIQVSDWKDAWKQATKEWNSNLYEAMITAGMSAGGSTIVSGVNNSINNQNYNRLLGNRALQNNMDSIMNDSSLSEKEKTEQAKQLQFSNARSLIEVGQKLKEGTESRKIADKLAEDMRSGKKINAREYGNLVRAIMNDSSEEVSKVAKTMLGDRLRNELIISGEKKEDAQRMSLVLTNAILQGEMSPQGMLEIYKSKRAVDLWMQYRDDTALRESFKAQTKETQEAQTSVMEMITDPVESGVTEEKTAEAMKGARVATDEEFRHATGDRTNSPTEAIADGFIGDIVGFGTRKYKDESGTVRTTVTVTVKNGEHTHTADIANVVAANEQVAQLLKLYDQDGGQTITENLAKTLITFADSGKNIARITSDAMNILWSEITDKHRVNTKLTADEEAQIRNAIDEDVQNADNRRLKQKRQLMPGKGKTVFKGFEYGSKEFHTELGKLGRRTQQEAEAVASIAKSMGETVELYFDETDTANQGAYNSEDGIRINLAGTYTLDGIRKSALAVFSHEVIHHFEANSQGGYAALRSFVLTNLQKAGMDLRNELGRIIANYSAHGQQIDIFGAISEMVAMGNEQVLTDEDVVSRLKEEDPSLFRNLQKSVRRICGLIRGIKLDAQLTSSRYAQALEGLTKEIGQFWLGAYAEAKEAVGTGESGDEVKYSLTPYTEAEAQGITQDKRNIIYDGNRKTFTNFYNRGINAKNDIEKMYFGKIDQSLGNRIKADTGIDVEGFDLVLANHEIRKISVISHGNAAKEAARGQVVIGEQELFDAINVIKDYDSAELDKKPYMGLPLINFKKNINGVETVAAYKATGRGELRIETVYKGINKNGSLPTVRGVTSSPLTSKTGRGLTSNTTITQNNNNNNNKTQNSFREDLDAKYMEAVENGDMKTAEDMLIEKAMQTPGITGYYATAFNAGHAAEIAKRIKQNDPEAIREAVTAMAPHVPENAVLIPVPNHNGEVLEDTDTFIMAKAISEETGAPVLKALESDPHESRRVAKQNGNRLKAEDMGFRQVLQIPEGKMPVFIDNMVAGGETAKAARNAIGYGFTLAYAQSSRDKSKGVKSLAVTTDRDGNVIPLSKRMDPENRSWKYSMREDENYRAAVNSGDMDQAQWYVNEAAERAGYDIENVAYHGTDDFGFTKFDLEKGRDTIFVAYVKNVAGTYTNTKRIRQVKDRVVTADTSNMTDEQFAEHYKKKAKKYLGLEIIDVKKNNESSTDGNTWYNIEAFDEINNEAMELIETRRGLEQDLWLQLHPNMEDQGIYELYTKPGKQLVVDAEGNQWDEIEFDLYGWKVKTDNYGGEELIPTDYSWDPEFDYQEYLYGMYSMHATPRDIARWAKAHGYESVRINNVYDSGGKTDSYENGYGDIGIFFNESQVKSADPVTYDDNGNVIPPSERFNQKEEDIRYSFRDEGDIDVRAWMETVNESSLQTEAEKELLRNYKSLRMRVSLKQEQERKYRRQIAEIEAKPEASRTKEDERMLQGLRVRLENATKIKEQAEEELAKITGSQGYASMMYRQRRILNDYMYGRTQEEVRSTVERLEKSAARVAAVIEENRKAAEELEKSGIVDRFRKLLGTTTADQTAADLKKEYHSTWTKAQIRNYLDPIIAKMVAGENYEQDVEELAGILVNSDSRNTYEELSALRGLTITLGKGAQAELKAQHSSLKEVRARLAGTGITVKYGERSSLETDIEDLRAEYPSIPDLGDEKDALGNFLDWIDGMKAQSAAGEFYDQKIAEAMAVITGKAAGAATGIYMPNDRKAQQQVLAMMDFVKSLNAETQAAQEALQSVADDLAEMQKAGQQASGMANTMAHDANVAIDYFNKMAKIAEETQKQKTRTDLIAQLKSEQAQKILKNNEEWRNLIERDKNARAQAEDNMRSRAQINTVVRRLYNLLKNPKGLNNIQEHMQGLAREVIGTIVNNDLDGRKITQITRKELEEAKRVLDAWTARDGKFDISSLLAMDEENYGITIINQDLLYLYEGLEAYNSEIRGKNKLDILQQRGEILKNMQQAVSEIYSFIKAETEIALGDRRVAVEDAAYKVATEAEKSRFKGERTGATRGVRNFLHKAIVSGNMTPEYFFRTIGNEGMTDLWNEYHRAENRNGLELRKAQERLAEIAEKHGYKNWDPNQKMTIQVSGENVEMTLGQVMSLWATWKREKVLGPEMSEHLTKGGFYVEQNLDKGIAGRQKLQKRSYRVTEADMEAVKNQLTDEQRKYVDDVVLFMSRDLSKLGNEASMKAYGIRLYKEKYYFPFQMWDGVRSRKSNDAGQGAGGNQAFHPSFSKTRLHGANNAVILGDFTQTAADHIVGMINYATMGLANENLNKVLNQQTSADAYGTKRNTRAIFEEAYGREALQYLMDLKVQLEGGAYKVEKSAYDKLISVFRKNAVAGSMSVAMQQPLSYIRAAMMISPKYLTAALNPATYKGSYKEMIAHSGVAVIKNMGRFDMNAGQSAREFLMPESREGKARQAWDFVTDKLTILPELMDRMTWTRMWTACKAEQKALHPEMDVKSEEFLDAVAERFNDIMRRTQVYDSVLVKSANMRNQNPAMKAITSFMAEPTLTANVLADAVRQAVQHEKGGMKNAAKAGAVFLISAVLQAAVKAGWSTGRTPDDKKNGLENFLNRFWSNLIGEVDLFNLIPGYGYIIDAFKGTDITDNAWGTLTKLISAGQTGIDALLGKKSRGAYRDIEDSVGQLMQLFTHLPAKNLMRDGRAVYNWITGASEATSPYAWRPTSGNVIRYQSKDTFMTADNLIGVVNQYLGEAGYDTSTTGYYKRVYEAIKAGNTERKESLIDYLLKGKGIKEEKTITQKVNSLAKEDEALTPEETVRFLQNNNGGQIGSYITDLYKDGKIGREEAEKLYREVNKKATDKDVLEAFDRVDYKKAGGEAENYSNYTPIYEAMDAEDGKALEERKRYLIDHGYKEKDVLSAMKSHIKNRYKEEEISRKEAEALYKKYDPDMKESEIAKALDEIDYEKRTGEDVENYTNYTPLYDAVDGEKAADVSAEIERLKKLDYKAEAIDSAISSHIMAQYKAGDLNRQQAEKRMKAYCKSMTANDVWWTFDRADYNTQTGKDAGSGKYYRLWNAMEANNSGQISSAISGMTAHGVEKKNIKEQIPKHFKEDYLSAGQSGKVKIRDAMQKAYKALGYDPAEADKAIANWEKKK